MWRGTGRITATEFVARMKSGESASAPTHTPDCIRATAPAPPLTRVATRNTSSPILLGAFAQTTGSTVQRDVNQEKRIEQGLQDGKITTREAAILERDESKVD